MSGTFLPYAHQSINQADLDAVKEALSREVITRGETVEEFEKTFAQYCGAYHAVAFNSASTALAAACHAAKVTPADKVLTTPNTFVATSGAAMHMGASPVFIDIDRSNGSIDLNLLYENLDFSSSRGRLVLMPVHFAGIPIDMKQIYQRMRHPEAVVIEDAAHALGSFYPDGQKVGSCAWSDMTIFSFHPAKQITTGEGGMVTTNDTEYDRRLRLYRNNGIVRDPAYLKGPTFPGYYEVNEVTGNFNFTDFQAALGLSQMRRLDDFVLKRRRLMALYREQLKEVPHLRLLTDAFDQQVSFCMAIAQIDFAAYRTTRASVMESLKASGIGTQVHYIPIYHHPFFQQYSTVELADYFPEMEAYYSQALTLPLYQDLTEDDVKRVCTELKAALSRK